jgi:hypothetical protein
MLLEPLWIDCPDLSQEKILSYSPAPGEIVFVDVATSVSKDSFMRPLGRSEPWKADPKGFLDRFCPDFYLVPVNLESGIEASVVKNFIEGGALHAPNLIVHRPRSMSLDIGSLIADAGLDVNTHNFYPFFIPQTASTSASIPRDMLSDWQDEDQHHHHYQLLEFVLNKLGGDDRRELQIATTDKRNEPLRTAGISGKDNEAGAAFRVTPSTPTNLYS